MTFFRLVRRSLCFYWRANLGVLLAASVATAVLVGALVVGDSVRHSLRTTAIARLGNTKLALLAPDRFFRAKLADEIAPDLDTTVAPVLYTRGLVSNSDQTHWANRVEIFGVDKRFYDIGSAQNPFAGNFTDEVILNKAVAGKIGVVPGDEVVLRISKPSLMPRDIPLTPDSDMSTAFRLKVKAIAGKSEFGRFSLRANQISSLNVFLPLEWLQNKLGRTAKANMLLVAENLHTDITPNKANQAIKKHWQLADAELELRPLKRLHNLELRSSRVFIDDSTAKAAMHADATAVGFLTYFVNELRLGDKTTPYSTVTALSKSKDFENIMPADMRDDEIVINQWLADDLDAKKGDTLTLTYFTIGPMRKLIEQTGSFRVRRIVPIEGLAADRELMPDFPGLSKVQNCRDWKPGIPIDLHKIRPRDEDYWDRYRGTPKAFITLEAGRTMWKNRYGSLTAVRYRSTPDRRQDIAAKLLKSIEPASVGLFFEDLRQRALKASDQATDFGQLFLGFSFFLIAAAVVLTTVVFVFGVENRTSQIGMLMAVGLSPRQIRWQLLTEGCILALLAAAAGSAIGLLYNKAVIYGLSTIWQRAVSFPRGIGGRGHFFRSNGTCFTQEATSLCSSTSRR